MNNKQKSRLIIVLILLVGVVYFFPKESQKVVGKTKEVAGRFVSVKIK